LEALFLKLWQENLFHEAFMGMQQAHSMQNFHTLNFMFLELMLVPPFLKFSHQILHTY
jgi:hypothetical protein